MDNRLKIILGSFITAVSGFIGGKDGIMYALIACMTADYLTGVAVAVKEKKLSSEVGFWGLVRKCCILLLVGIAHYIDSYVLHDGEVFRAAVSLYYIGNEGVSLIENCDALGLPTPPKLRAVMAQIKNKGDKEEK